LLWFFYLKISIENFIKKFLPGALLKPQKRINRPTILLRKWLGAEVLCTHCVQNILR